LGARAYAGPAPREGAAMAFLPHHLSAVVHCWCLGGQIVRLALVARPTGEGHRLGYGQTGQHPIILPGGPG